MRGFIHNLPNNNDEFDRDSAIERQTFKTTLFATRTGNEAVGTCRWADRVEIVSREDGRSNIIMPDGTEGFVANSFLAEVKYITADNPDPRVEGNAEKKKYACKMFETATNDEEVTILLWGDEVKVVGKSGNRSRAWARGRWGWVETDRLSDAPLLELYFIDVGQGDGVLMRLPDGRHLLIDGGFQRLRQPTNRNAADFVDWKFYKDYGDHTIRLDAMIASHCDADHYGGLDDLINTSKTARAELDCAAVEIGAFFHSGVSWWVPTQEEKNHGEVSSSTTRWLGPVQGKRLIRLLDDQNSAATATATNAEPSLQGQWKTFIKRIGKKTTNFVRLGINKHKVNKEHFLPGFEPQPDTASIRVLGPVTETKSGKQVLVDLEADSQNTNGHSSLLRVDYGLTKIMLTGDLNQKSMQLLLKYYEGHESVLACDVAKGCHHGSADVSFRFLKAMEPCATVIQSGDAEGHAHPRPVIVAASGMTGHQKKKPIPGDFVSDEEMITPLVYCTEIERSVSLGQVQTLKATEIPAGAGTIGVKLYARQSRDYSKTADKNSANAQKDTQGKYDIKEAAPGRFRAKRRTKPFKGAYLLSGIVYGLVNVRTDGETIMCATMEETGEGWSIRHFRSRFA